MTFDRFDIHQHVTDQIVAMLDQAKGDFRLPWHTPGSIMRPINVASAKPYQGVNILALWAEAEKRGYGSGVWGTYRQWAALGAQVRKGEKAAYVVFYKEAAGSRDAAAADDAAQNAEPARRLVTRASAVFAVEQVDGYTVPEIPAARSCHCGRTGRSLRRRDARQNYPRGPSRLLSALDRYHPYAAALSLHRHLDQLTNGSLLLDPFP